jgi:pyruvate formate lyase activating enzyme
MIKIKGESMEDFSKPLSKRKFVKYCVLGAGGCFLGLNRFNSFLPVKEHNDIYQPSTDEPGKWSREAMFYSKTSDGVQCEKCPHACFLAPNETGFCRNRLNYNGKLYTIAYGNPCAVHIDPVEKKPLFHFLPATRAFSIAVAGCNLRCLNCQNWEISQFSPKETTNVDLPPEKVVEQCGENHCESIAYTYSEPTTFYEYAFDTAVIARKAGIKNIWKSSGYINETPLRRLCRVLDAANIDLKGFDNDVYLKLNGVRLEPVLRTLKIFKEENVWLEITNLVVPTWTDNLDTIKKMCEWLAKNGLADSPLHFSRFTPLYKLNQLPLTPVSTLDKAREIAVGAGLRYVYIGNVPGHTAENTFCPKCHKIIIERKGFSILNNFIVKNHCKFCGEIIPGVWS